MKSRILFLAKKRDEIYSSYGLVNSAQFVVNALVRAGFEAKVEAVTDSNEIDREVHRYKPNCVILEAIWVPPYKMAELLRKYKKILWSVRIHSKILFLAVEGMAFDWIRAYRNLQSEFDNFVLSANSKELIYELKKLWSFGEDKLVYTPNIYETKHHPENICEENKLKDCDEVDIGCFGAIRPMKNQLIQAIASIIFGNENDIRVRFHMNTDRVEQGGQNVLRNIQAVFMGSQHELIEHPWLSHEDFIELVKAMDLGLQVSISETFCIVAADFVHHYKPVVVSDEVDWLPSSCFASPKSAKDIANKIKTSLRTSGMSVVKNFAALKRFNAKALRHWIEFLKNN